MQSPGLWNRALVPTGPLVIYKSCLRQGNGGNHEQNGCQFPFPAVYGKSINRELLLVHLSHVDFLPPVLLIVLFQRPPRRVPGIADLGRIEKSLAGREAQVFLGVR